MERYSEYKDSGVKWLGEIPSHWEVRKIIGSFSENKKKNTNFTFTRAMQFNYGTIVDKNEGFDTTETKSIYCNYALINRGDIVINGLNLNYDFISQRVAISPKDGIITSAYVIVSPRENMNPYYFCYLFKDMDNMKMFHGMGTGVRKTLSFKELRNQLIPIPTLEEQDAIVRYLDAATSKIDKAIAMQQKMIDLLNERKQITIQNAVTKGLDENVEMKDSGVEWIGMIPKHWEIKRLKYVMHSYGRIGFRGYGTDDIVDEGQGAITLSPSNIQDSSMDYSKKTYLSWNKYYESPEIMIKNGDVLMVKTGSSYGKCAVVKGLPMECTINPQLVVFKEHKELPEFLAYSFQTTYAKCFINTSVIGGTIPTISQEKINNYIFPFPPKTEQQAIVAYLDKEMLNFDSAISNCQRQITLLQERKQIIINEVVTGKVKVS